MKVSFLVVEWKGGNILSRCLAAAATTAERAHLEDYEIVVVNNNASPLYLPPIECGSRIRVVESGGNSGFAIGTNASVEASCFEYIFLMNNDIILEPDCLSRLAAGMETTAADAAVPRLQYPDGTLQSSIRGLPTLRGIWMESLGIARLLPRQDTWLIRSFDYNSVQFVEQPMFSALFMPRQIWRTVGGLDVDFPILFNDVDWFYRFHGKGLRCAYVPEAKAIHHHGMSVNRHPFRKVWRSTNGMYRYFLKNGHRYPLAIISLVILCASTFWGRIAVEAIYGAKRAASGRKNTSDTGKPALRGCATNG